jgi:hypothetical protein
VTQSIKRQVCGPANKRALLQIFSDKIATCARAWQPAAFDHSRHSRHSRHQFSASPQPRGTPIRSSSPLSTLHSRAHTAHSHSQSQHGRSRWDEERSPPAQRLSCHRRIHVSPWPYDIRLASPVSGLRREPTHTSSCHSGSPTYRRLRRIS